MQADIRKKSRWRPGFTIVELLVVIAIIGLLSTLAVVAYTEARNKAKIAKAMHEVDQLATAIQELGLDSGQWPNHQPIDQTAGGAGNNEICETCPVKLSDEAAGLVLDHSADPYPNWRGPYLAKIPDDPWGHQYIFDTDYQINPSDSTPCAGRPDCIDAAVVGSYGPNGEAINLYDADDIIKVIYKE